MKFQRLELHNHTNESDGQLTVRELLDYAQEKKFGVLALTDHNIISGHAKAIEYIESNNLDIQLIKGIELTTSYGHILVLGMETVFDFTDLSPYQSNSLFRRIRENGGQLIGLAHPFCVGNPIMTGCRLYFEIEDYSEVDYIEVFNTVLGDNEQGDLYIGNYQALSYWENLVLNGNEIAAVTGKDLHQYPKDEAMMVTYLKMDDSTELSSETINKAIQSQKTFVTKGPLVDSYLSDSNEIIIKISHENEYYGWNQKYKETKPIIVIKDNFGNVIKENIDFNENQFTFTPNSSATHFVIRLYDGQVKDSRLLTAGIILSKRKEITNA